MIGEEVSILPQSGLQQANVVDIVVVVIVVVVLIVGMLGEDELSSFLPPVSLLLSVHIFVGIQRLEGSVIVGRLQVGRGSSCDTEDMGCRLRGSSLRNGSTKSRIHGHKY